MREKSRGEGQHKDELLSVGGIGTLGTLLLEGATPRELSKEASTSLGTAFTWAIAAIAASNFEAGVAAETTVLASCIGTTGFANCDSLDFEKSANDIGVSRDLSGCADMTDARLSRLPLVVDVARGILEKDESKRTTTQLLLTNDTSCRDHSSNLKKNWSQAHAISQHGERSSIRVFRDERGVSNSISPSVFPRPILRNSV